jgi:hypothetical protein
MTANGGIALPVAAFSSISTSSLRPIIGEHAIVYRRRFRHVDSAG